MTIQGFSGLVQVKSYLIVTIKTDSGISAIVKPWTN